MTKKSCVICAIEFDVWGKAKTCSPECSKAAFLEYKRKWRRQPKVRETERGYAREYHQKSEVKEADRERDRKRRQRPERKEYERERKRRPERKEYMREYGREYIQRPDVKERKRKYSQEYGRKPDVKEKRDAHRQRSEIKEQRRAYAQRPDARASKIARAQTLEYKEKARAYNAQPLPTKKRRATTLRWRTRTKSEALAFARELLAGKYPDLIPTNHKPCLLYTATCRETGRILYIGITKNWEARQTQHAATHKGALWLPTAEITIDVYPSRTLAMAAEMVSIKERAPVFNVVHNDRSHLNRFAETLIRAGARNVVIRRESRAIGASC